MKGREYLLFFFAAIFLGAAFYFNSGDVFAGTLTCTVTSTCNSPGVVVLRLASTTNSHSELPTGSSYPNLVCCSGVTGLGNSCAAGIKAVVVNLASTTNSHIEEGLLGNYSVQACLSVTAGTVSIGYTSTSSCTGFDTTLFSMSSSTNAHAAKPGTSTFQPGATLQVCGTAAAAVNAAPTVTGISANGGASIVLTPNTTTSVNINATIGDTNGCGDITGGTTTIMLYRSGVTSSTCKTSANNADCYVATAFSASSTCTTNSVNTTTTFGVYYFAQATDASSSFPSQNWLATIIFKDPSDATGSADSSGQELLTLNAINVTTSSIGYGTLTPSSTTGSVNQSTTIQNVGNSSTSLQISGTALISGARIIATSSQHFATSSFTFGGTEQQLNGVPAIVSGFTLTAPTSTGTVQKSIFWGVQVPAGSATGTYSATTTFTAVFSP